MQKLTQRQRDEFLDKAAIAGEVLAKAVEEIAPTTNARGSLDFEVFRYRSAIKEKNV